MASTNIQTVTLSGYSATVDGANYLCLGTWDSYGIEQLQINPGPEWAGLVIKATFNTSAGATPVVVPESGLINVPPEATAQALTVGAPGLLVFSGTTDGQQRITCNLMFIVRDHAPIDGTAPAPTPDEWQQFVAMVQQYAQQAGQSATAAAQSATEAAGSATQAAQSETNAAASATAAAGSAADAATELAKVQGAGNAALTAIGSAQSTAVGEVQTAQTAATQAVEQTGTAQVNAVNTAGDAKLAEINAANALLPTPTEADAGKAPIARPDGTYALEAVTVDAYTKSESDARYAPIEAAIKVSGKGTGLVSLSPTVAWQPQGMKLYGRSWQDGTPSVETEVPIQDAGDSGTVDVTVCGANLFDIMRLSYQVPTGTRFKDLSVSDGVASFVSTGGDTYLGTTLNRGITAVGNQFVLSFSARPNTAYTIRLSNSRLIKNFVTFLDKNDVSISGGTYFSSPVFTFVTPQDCVTVLFRIGNGNSVEGESYATTIMVNIGDTAQPWKPYTAQQLVVPTPDGLPGIPVDTGGNWVDESGQQWVSDVVDFASQEKTHRIYKETIPLQWANNRYLGRTTYDTDPRYTECLCNRLVYNKNATNGEIRMSPQYRDTNVVAYAPEGSLTEVEVMYILAEPITTPLDSETLAAYKALTTYPGTTNVLAPDCGIEASAVGDATQILADINAKITALQSAAAGT